MSRAGKVGGQHALRVAPSPDPLQGKWALDGTRVSDISGEAEGRLGGPQWLDRQGPTPGQERLQPRGGAARAPAPFPGLEEIVEGPRLTLIM